MNNRPQKSPKSKLRVRVRSVPGAGLRAKTPDEQTERMLLFYKQVCRDRANPNERTEWRKGLRPLPAACLVESITSFFQNPVGPGPLISLSFQGVDVFRVGPPFAFPNWRKNRILEFQNRVPLSGESVHG
jgi:hypothetical protein